MITDLVSVCIPTYNGEMFIKEALESVAQQTYKNIEIIVSDDNSSDKTLEIINQFLEENTIACTILKHKPAGIGANWNNCITNANGEYIKFLFQDDLLEADCIEKMMAILITQDDSTALVACKRNFILSYDSSSKAIENWINKYGDLQKAYNKNNKKTFLIDKKVFTNKNFFDHPRNKIGEPITILFKKSLTKKIGLYNLELKQSLDYEFYYRTLKEHKIILLNEKLVKFRLHASQATNVNSKKGHNDQKMLNQLLLKEYYKYFSLGNQLEILYSLSPFYKLNKRIYNKISRIFN